MDYEEQIKREVLGTAITKEDIDTDNADGILSDLANSVIVTVDNLMEEKDKEIEKIEDEKTSLEGQVSDRDEEAEEHKAFKERVKKVFGDVCEECLKTTICKLTGCLICHMKRDIDL